MSAQKRSELLVGSVPLVDEQAVLSMAGDVLGEGVASLPDGEIGDLSNWIEWQRVALLAAHLLEVVLIDSVAGNVTRRVVLALRGDAAPYAAFGPLEHAVVAKRTCETFKTLCEAGRLAPSMRFQVSLPTVTAPMETFVNGTVASISRDCAHLPARH